jgi:hypothetical protein
MPVFPAFADASTRTTGRREVIRVGDSCDIARRISDSISARRRTGSNPLAEEASMATASMWTRVRLTSAPSC